ncbi:hypothetical protein B0H10DRAFT_2137610 [Mycena sp. CBHHK59/15]|nr:hypothetical protein B0H10DRAFT_2137610 [Mycena sp. CBHHK59/15]
MGDTVAAQSRPRRPRKRSRKSKTQTRNLDLPVPAYFFRLPFELIADILLYTASPKDVLAVARCSKFLCKTLLREDSAFIWRSVRMHCTSGPLPDPLPNFTEASYAALIFDIGNCKSCKQPTAHMYASWSLRLRFCHRPECKSAYYKTHIKRIAEHHVLTESTRKALQWIPLRKNPLITWPDSDKIYSTSAMNGALLEYAAAPSAVVDQRHAVDIARSPLKCHFMNLRTRNENFGKALAKREGYDYTDLLNSSKTYQDLHSTHYKLLAAQIEVEMIHVQEKRQRSLDEITTKTNRTQIDQHYQRLVSASASKVLPFPSLAQFRAMPILDLLQSSSASASAAIGPTAKKVPGISHELKSATLVNQLLTSELARWRSGAEAALLVTLGLPEWKTARNNRLQPVARLTARWNCGQCGGVAKAYKWDECLDYEGVCKHECPMSKKKNKGETGWKAERFVKDDKAINAMTKLVKLCEIDAEDSGSYKALDAVGPRILCRSCPTAIVMWPTNVVGHSHRHDEMEMTLLTQTEADALVVAPVEKNLAMKVMGYIDYKTKRVLNTWMYGCRYCQPPNAPSEKTPVEIKTPETADAGAGGQEQIVESDPEPVKKDTHQKKRVKRFEFCGLRSHLKEKHSIHLPRDEDFYHILDTAPPQRRHPNPRFRRAFDDLISTALCEVLSYVPS